MTEPGGTHEPVQGQGGPGTDPARAVLLLRGTHQRVPQRIRVPAGACPRGGPDRDCGGAAGVARPERAAHPLGAVRPRRRAAQLRGRSRGRPHLLRRSRLGEAGPGHRQRGGVREYRRVRGDVGAGAVRRLRVRFARAISLRSRGARTPAPDHATRFPGCGGCSRASYGDAIGDLPDQHNTNLAIEYSSGGFVRASNRLDDGLSRRAGGLIDLVGLDRHGARGWPSPTARDQRWSQREEVWAAAERCRSDFESLGVPDEAIGLVLEAARGYGFFSVWMTVDPIARRVPGAEQSAYRADRAGARNESLRVTRDAGCYRPTFPNPSSTTTSRSVGPLRRVDSSMAGPMSSASVMRAAVTPIERASPVKSIGGSLNSMPV